MVVPEEINGFDCSKVIAGNDPLSCSFIESYLYL